jgi:hypothetical protein
MGRLTWNEMSRLGLAKTIRSGIVMTRSFPIYEDLQGGTLRDGERKGALTAAARFATVRGREH